MATRLESTGESRDGGRRLQFSMRGLLQLMLAVAVILGLGAICRESEQFQGVYCLWSLLAVLVVGAIWIANRLRLVGPRMLAYGSLAVYVLSLVVPAWSDTEVAFGFMYAYASTMMTLTFDLTGPFIGRWLSVAVAFGGIANLAFLVGYISLLVGIKWNRCRRVAGWFAALSVVTAVATVPLMSFNSSRNAVFPTFCLWLASPWALLLGTLGMKVPAADGSDGGTLPCRP